MNTDESKKIGVVVVTHNRKDLLLKCLQGISDQEYKTSGIIIVDNYSTDATDEVVRSINNPKIKYVKLDNNTGSAGGFKEGIKVAYEDGYEWIWLLDDDVVPHPDCLKVMMRYSHFSQCIHPSKKDVHGKEFMWENIFNPITGRATILENISFKNGKDFTFVNMGCFEGMLIKRDVVKKIGYPDDRFFIAGDDAIYGFLASLYTNVTFVRDARLTKLIGFNERPGPVFLYYAIRNQFLIGEHLKKAGIFRKFTFYRHMFFYVIYASIKQTIRNRSVKTPFFILLGLIHGLKGRFYKL